MNYFQSKVVMILMCILTYVFADDFLVCSRQFCLPSDYNKVELPPTPNMEPVKVSTGFHILQYTSVDDRNSIINMVMYMILTWDEPRIEFVANTSAKHKMVALGTELTNQVWLPDLYIYSLMSAKITKIVENIAAAGMKCSVFRFQ